MLNNAIHVDDLNQFGLRSKIKDEINDSWVVLLGGDYAHRNDTSDCVCTALLRSDIPQPPQVEPAFSPRDTYTDIDRSPYLDARYESFPDAQVPNIVNGELATATPIGYEKSVNASGNRAERSPQLTATARLQWLVPVSTGNISTTASCYHNSGFYFDAGDEAQQKAYNLVNLHVQYASQTNRWSVAAWINNAFNATLVAGVGISPYVVAAQYTDPRLFGLSATVHY